MFDRACRTSQDSYVIGNVILIPYNSCIRECTIELIILELSFDVCRKLVNYFSRLGRIILVKASIVIASCMVSVDKYGLATVCKYKLKLLSVNILVSDIYKFMY